MASTTRADYEIYDETGMVLVTFTTYEYEANRILDAFNSSQDFDEQYSMDQLN